jgi:hypothetical protein
MDEQHPPFEARCGSRVHVRASWPGATPPPNFKLKVVFVEDFKAYAALRDLITRRPGGGIRPYDPRRNGVVLLDIDVLIQDWIDQKNHGKPIKHITKLRRMSTNSD